MHIFPRKQLALVSMLPPQEVMDRLDHLVGERTLTDELLRLRHFPLQGTLSDREFDLTIVGTSPLRFALPRLVGRVDQAAGGSAIYAFVAYDAAKDLFMLLWCTICIAATLLILISWKMNIGHFYVQPLQAIAAPVGLAAYGVVLYLNGLIHGARIARSLLATLLDSNDERSA